MGLGFASCSACALILHLDVCMCCLHFLTWYLVLDPLQTEFCLHCDTRATFAEVRKGHLWAFFSVHLTHWLTPLLPSFKCGWPSDSSSAPVLPPTLQYELFLNDLTYVMASVMGDSKWLPSFVYSSQAFIWSPSFYSFEISSGLSQKLLRHLNVIHDAFLSLRFRLSTVMFKSLPTVVDFNI